MMRMRLWVVCALMITLFITPSGTSAHGYLVRAIPENRAVLERAPTRVQYWFSEALESRFSTIHVRDQMGNIIATGGLSDKDNTLLTARLPNQLPNGAYIVELRPAFASDGHVYAESRVFFIGEAIGGIDAASATTALPLEVVWRFITISASTILFGTLALYSWVLIPAWGNRTHKAGWLPSRLMKRLHIIIGVSLLVAFLGNGLALIQQTMVFFNISFEQALQPQFWEVVRVGSRFGDVWMWRMGLMSLFGMMFLATLNYQHRYPEFVYPFWMAGLWICALILGTFSITSHAAGALTMAWIGVFVDWGHKLAVAIWVGGLFALMICLNVALAPYADEQRLHALRVVIKRFSLVAIGALVVTIASGMYNASNWIYSMDEVQTSFGMTLIAKIVLIIPLLGIGAMNHLLAHPEQYGRLRRWIDPKLGQFIHITRFEVIFASIVVVSASTLSATPLPTPSFIQSDVQAPSATQVIDNLTISMNISPGGTGVNTFDIRLLRDDTPITNADVRLLNNAPTYDRRGDVHFVEPIDDGLYVAAGAEVDQGGIWWSLVDVRLDDVRHRVAFAWEIDPNAGVIISLPPTPIQLSALGGVMIAVMVALSPLIRSRIHKMGMNTFTVSAAIAAVVLTGIALVIGWRVMENTQQEYLRTLNPPPTIVNTNLPTAESLARGEHLLVIHCPTWQTTSDFKVLIERLNRTRDEALYSALVDGWRNLPACAENVSPENRWDMVNYIRSLGM